MARYFESRLTEPISQTVNLPLDFYNRKIQEEQKLYDTTEDELAAMTLSGDYIPGSVDYNAVVGVEQKFKDDLAKLTEAFYTSSDVNPSGATLRELKKLEQWKTSQLAPTGTLGQTAQQKKAWEDYIKQIDNSDLPENVRILAKQKALEEYNTAGGVPKGAQYYGHYNPHVDIPTRLMAIADKMKPEDITRETGWSFDPNAMLWRNGSVTSVTMPYQDIKDANGNVVRQGILSKLVNYAYNDPDITNYTGFLKNVGALYQDDPNTDVDEGSQEYYLQQMARGVAPAYIRNDSKQTFDIQNPNERFLDFNGFAVGGANDPNVEPVSYTTWNSPLVDLQNSPDTFNSYFDSGMLVSANKKGLAGGITAGKGVYKGDVYSNKQKQEIQMISNVVAQARNKEPNKYPITMNDQQVFNDYMTNNKNIAIPQTYTANQGRLAGTTDILTSTQLAGKQVRIDGVPVDPKAVPGAILVEAGFTVGSDGGYQLGGADIKDVPFGWDYHSNPGQIWYTSDVGDKSLQIRPPADISIIGDRTAKIMQQIPNLTKAAGSRVSDVETIYNLPELGYTKKQFEKIIYTPDGEYIIRTDNKGVAQQLDAFNNANDYDNSWNNLGTTLNQLAVMKQVQIEPVSYMLDKTNIEVAKKTEELLEEQGEAFEPVTQPQSKRQ